MSILKDKIYPSRYTQIEDLNKIGFIMSVKDDSLVVSNSSSYVSEEVYCKDLRGGISLVIAGLIAKGESRVDGVKYIKRGYSDLIYKLNNVGADIKLERVNDDEYKNVEIFYCCVLCDCYIACIG